MLGFLYRVVLSWNLSPSTLGAYTIALSVCSAFTTLLCSGIPLVVSRTVASNEVKKQHQSSYGVVFSGVVLSCIISFLIVLFTIFGKKLFDIIFTDNVSYVVLLTLLPFVISTAIYTSLRGYLWGKEKYFEVSMVELIEQVVKIVLCIVLFIALKNAYIYVPGLAISLACILSTIVGFYYFKKASGRLKPLAGTFTPLVKKSLPLILVRFVGSLITPFISIILPLVLIKCGYSSEQALAFIGISMGMVLPLLSVPSTVIGSLSMALIPQLNILKEKNSYTQLRHQINSSFVFTICATFIFVPIFSSIGVPVCEILFNSTKAGEILKAFSWIMIPNGIMMISTSILNSLGYEKFTFFSYGISSIVLILGVLVLPSYMGINALFLALGLNSLLVFILNYIKIKKLVGLNNNIINKSLILLGLSFPITLLCKYIYNVLLLIFPAIISIGLVCIISVFASGTLMFVFNIINIEYFKNLKDGFISRVRINKIKSKKRHHKV